MERGDDAALGVEHEHVRALAERLVHERDRLGTAAQIEGDGAAAGVEDTLEAGTVEQIAQLLRDALRGSTAGALGDAPEIRVGWIGREEQHDAQLAGADP